MKSFQANFLTNRSNISVTETCWFENWKMSVLIALLSISCLRKKNSRTKFKLTAYCQPEVRQFLNAGFWGLDDRTYIKCFEEKLIWKVRSSFFGAFFLWTVRIPKKRPEILTFLLCRHYCKKMFAIEIFLQESEVVLLGFYCFQL